MNLKTWLILHRMNHQTFADMIGKNKSLVHKYLHEGVIPKHDVLVKIYKVTQGRVTANDFHDLRNEMLDEETNGSNPSSYKPC